jgi:hypothetical protein
VIPPVLLVTLNNRVEISPRRIKGATLKQKKEKIA